MKHKTLTTILLTTILMLLGQSCRVRSINGELDAQWQITSIVYADGSQAELLPDGLYVSFYRHTIQFYTPPAVWENRPTGNMVYDENTQMIAVEMPYWAPEFHNWGLDIPADLQAKPYTTTLQVLSLSDKYLTLRTPEGTVISLRKY